MTRRSQTFCRATSYVHPTVTLSTGEIGGRRVYQRDDHAKGRRELWRGRKWPQAEIQGGCGKGKSDAKVPGKAAQSGGGMAAEMQCTFVKPARQQTSKPGRKWHRWAGDAAIRGDVSQIILVC